ncbi:S41 family peptidase [Gimibacter soli]|uniref:S41 family peptidase n=1 Tax=Gimibacter soli TaxID=3024400 RepID=A0AAE9XMV4_9PROT|nr:S41 family peptidase [Gimibacter soli]WCL53918.1 S41 family peptidase [Gimibacter soli]
MIRHTLAACLLFTSFTGAASAATLTPADIHNVVANAANLLEKRYVDPDLGARLARDIRNQSAIWEKEQDPEALARKVTDWLRAASGDGHLGLGYSKEALTDTAAEEDFSAAEMDRWYGPQINHGIEKIERLEGNVMLIDLRVFPPASMAGDIFSAAMALVAQGDALIIDLRKNGGGAETVNLVTGYLLDGARPLSGIYNRPSDTMQANVSPSWVPGRRFGGTKPLYILTSHRTFSAAEALAYDLQALGRATIVGEVTGGGAHPYEMRRVHDHFTLDLPEGRSVNPITGGNWQGTGVQPDVRIPADKALETALRLAHEKLGRAE